MMWLQFGDEPKTAPSAPLVIRLDPVTPVRLGDSYIVSLEGLAPLRIDERFGVFAMPPPASAEMPRLTIQYRADFPKSLTFEADGAFVAEHAESAAALNLTSRVVWSRAWWIPQLTYSLADLRVDRMPAGRMVYSNAVLRTEWKVRF